MRVTFTAREGGPAAVIADDATGLYVIEATEDLTQAVQLIAAARAEFAEPVARRTRTINLGVTVSREHSSDSAALAYRLQQYSILPAEGVLSIQHNGLTLYSVCALARVNNAGSRGKSTRLQYTLTCGAMTTTPPDL